MNGFRYRCPLGHSPDDRQDPESIKRDGWREEGILVIAPEDPRLDWAERQLLTQIAERLYGRRTVRHG